MFKEIEPQPHVIRMHAAVASALAKRKQVAIATCFLFANAEATAACILIT